MATTAENPGTVIGFSRLFGVDPGFKKKKDRKKRHTVCNVIQTLELDVPYGLLCLVQHYKIHCILCSSNE